MMHTRLNSIQDVWDRIMKEGCSQSRPSMTKEFFVFYATNTWHRGWRKVSLGWVAGDST